VLPGLGETCGYSCFDFDAFQDENWEGRQLGAAVVDDDAHSFIFSYDKPKTRQRHAVGVGVVRLLAEYYLTLLKTH
jgi:hypothetical protein